MKKEKDEVSETFVMEHNDDKEKISWLARMKLDTKKLAVNPLFVSYLVAAVTSGWVMAVKATFGQKYIEM